jgi:ABC-2 type transport system permease protein
MNNVFAAELRKLSPRPAVWWLGGMTLAIVGLVYGISYLQYNSSTFQVDPGVSLAAIKATLYPANFYRTVLQDSYLVGGALMLVMGALAVGSEYGWGTFKTMYTQGPGRITTLLGQLLALSVVNAVITGALYALGAGVSYLIATAAGGSTSWPATTNTLKAVAATWLIFQCWTILGMAMAFVLRQSAMAIGLGLAYMLAVEGILFTVLGNFNISWITTVEKFFVGQNVNALTTSFGQALTRRGTGAGATQLVSAEQAVLVILAYAVGLVFLSTILVRRRDVT